MEALWQTICYHRASPLNTTAKDAVLLEGDSSPRAASRVTGLAKPDYRLMLVTMKQNPCDSASIWCENYK